MSQRTFLYQLQTIDREIDQINERISTINHFIENDIEVIEAKKEVESNQRIFNENKEIADDLENQVNKNRKKIEQSESRLYGGNISNPKELQDLQSEIKSIKTRIASLEDEQLEAMVKMETIEIQLESAKNELLRILDEKGKTNNNLLSEKVVLENKLLLFEQQKATTKSLISDNLLSKYLKLRNSRNKVAVALLEDNSCNACGNILTSSDAQKVGSQLDEVYCNICNRFLYKV